MDGNQEFGFKHVEFEISFTHPGENVKLAAGVGGNVQAEDRVVGIISVQWRQSRETIEINWRVRVAIKDESLKSEPWGSVLLKLN